MIKRNFIECFILVSLIFVVNESIGQCNNQDDYTALRALYLATDGDNWTDNSGWPDASTFQNNQNIPVGTDMSTWYGIKCLNNRVDCVDLDGSPEDCEPSGSSGNGVSGYLPEEIVSLSVLRAISLQNMDMEFPDFNTDMVSLEVIGLDGNITGSIPSSIGNLQNLKQIDMSGKLSGPIPAEMGALLKLEEISFLFTNNLSGNIPAELGNLTNLRYLRLDGNQLSGAIPPELGDLANLDRLILRNNNLSGSLPSQLGNLFELSILDLGGNQISGTLPPEYGNLAGIFSMELNNNNLEGCIPEEWESLCPLSLVSLFNNPQLDNDDWPSFCSDQEGSCTMVSTNPVFASEINIYPNPTQGLIQIDSESEFNVLVYDVNGRVLLEKMEVNKIDIGSLGEGIYALVICGENSEVISVQKIMKQ